VTHETKGSIGRYGGYVHRLAKKVSARLADIEAVYNFDLGPEFEVAICHLLSDILPPKYGICRGFVVSEDGRKAGDDVIVFDRLQYPTLRSSVGSEFSLKDQVPIEGVYAYIECKHSIADRSTFDEAMRQVSDMKTLLLSRRELKNNHYETDGPVHNGKCQDWPRSWPRLKNQPFTMIIARKWAGVLPSPTATVLNPPDLAVLGEDHIMAQRAVLGSDGIKGALFHDCRHWAELGVDQIDKEAFGLGILMLMQAISWIELLPVDWTACLNEAFWTSLAPGSNGTK
jgi:hypothetical protein